MKKLMILMAALAATVSAKAATLNITGLLYTDQGRTNVPIELEYDPAGAVPYAGGEFGSAFTVVNPSAGGLAVAMTLNGVTYNQTQDGDFPDWPGMVLWNGSPFTFDFVVLNPYPGIDALGAGGPLMTDIVDGWSVQVFVDAGGGRYGSIGDPVAMALFAVPEPGSYALMAGLGLLGFVALRRRARG